MIITAILTVVNWLKGNFKALTISFICILTVSAFFMYNQLKKKDAEIARLVNNTSYYESLFDKKDLANRTLLLTIDLLKCSKDSIIELLNETKKKLKVKDKNLVQAQVINTEVKDSIKTVIQTKESDFSKKLKLNKLTTIIVSRKDSILSVTLDLKNALTLFIEEKKVYRNLYKSWLSRFFHFDFKKDKIRKFTIDNSNKLIKVTDTRIIEIK
ncbi:lysis regulatory protein-like protein [uncultured phage cr56_1]|uniref:Lysis regulatory protein-like protein n=1 Tax=uncultured phage cr56_1 TaxID=2772081 RepID=A0A7M1RRU1_9CAUD|nr:lysis regulatory protein-like protein [uncultured phage cr56_1]QOR56854.1 lysis regulatory protein-like protein [uncultured phage cr56_1]